MLYTDDLSSKSVVNAYYQAGVRGELTSFAPYVDPDFTALAPSYLPWGGFVHDASSFRDNILRLLPETLDFGRFQYDSFISEGEHVVALVEFGVVGTSDTIKISEHWTVRSGRARSLWVAYFEPQVLLRKLGLVALMGQ